MFPADDIFTAIPILPSMKRKSLKIKNPDSLQYIPSWKKSSRTSSLNLDKQSTKGMKLTAAESRAASRTPLSNVSQIVDEARVDRGDVTRMPEKQKENVELNRSLSIEIIGQVQAQTEIVTEIITDSDETKSLEIALSCIPPTHYSKNESDIWPYDVTFKDDKPLVYNSQAMLKPVSPIREGSNLPSRINELLKEQWLSPFSVLYMTRILSAFYDVSFQPSSKADIPVASSLALCNELNPYVQNAFKRSLKRRSRELQKLDGPISFVSLHRLSGKNAVQSNLPVRPILIGADGDYVSVAPNCLKSWRKLFLEPFAGSRDVAYVVVAPDSDLVLENTKQFFKELSMTYEVCKQQKTMCVKCRIACFYKTINICLFVSFYVFKKLLNLKRSLRQDLSNNISIVFSL